MGFKWKLGILQELFYEIYFNFESQLTMIQTTYFSNSPLSRKRGDSQNSTNVYPSSFWCCYMYMQTFKDELNQSVILSGGLSYWNTLLPVVHRKPLKLCRDLWPDFQLCCNKPSSRCASLNIICHDLVLVCNVRVWTLQGVSKSFFPQNLRI